MVEYAAMLELAWSHVKDWRIPLASRSLSTCTCSNRASAGTLDIPSNGTSLISGFSGGLNMGRSMVRSMSGDASLLHRPQIKDLGQERAQLVLPGRRHQEIPERAEALPLVGICDRIALAKDFFQ